MEFDGIESIESIVNSAKSGFTLFEKIHNYILTKKEKSSFFKGKKKDNNGRTKSYSNNAFKDSVQSEYVPFVIRLGSEFSLAIDKTEIMNLAITDAIKVWDWTILHSFNRDTVSNKVVKYIKGYYCDKEHPHLAKKDISTTSLRFCEKKVDSEIFGDAIYATGVVSAKGGYNHISFMKSSSFLPRLIIRKSGDEVEYFDDPLLINYYFTKVFDEAVSYGVDEENEMTFCKAAKSVASRKLNLNVLRNLGIE